ncbi:MAG: DUF2304 domain-containing protein [Anaerolineae bacterium]|nr:DUF2304 domain-containing protein [Anaerolineae bacterium]
MLSNIGRLEIIMLAGPAVMFLIVLEMVRRQRLREDYSLLWLATFGVLIVLALSREMLDTIADLIGIRYPPTALFVIATGLTLLVLLQFSAVITRLSRQNKQAAQRLALLDLQVRQLEEQLRQISSTEPSPPPGG